MNTAHHLAPLLPPNWLQYLGKLSTATQLSQALWDSAPKLFNGDAAELRLPMQNAAGDEIRLRPHGAQLILQAQRQDPVDRADAHTGSTHWGLHAIHLFAQPQPFGAWRGPWPGHLAPAELTPEKLLLALGADASQSMLSPSMACFTLQADDLQQWGVTGVFEQGLLSLHIVRISPWQHLQATTA
ncbi:hypothetical protein PSQ20_00175 [Curvibacter sp. RS43]|uniref:hypothetical protein n=1 Tax=Curvibacter microcysteis TaxID=3026419 RepID=UPI002360A220|nr:hypothetical protein [Curvibacter sp. RS43]MDD0808739.1 hypothetical protein [Curvibacter sp. RS43]